MIESKFLKNLRSPVFEWESDALKADCQAHNSRIEDLRKSLDSFQNDELRITAAATFEDLEKIIAAWRKRRVDCFLAVAALPDSRERLRLRYVTEQKKAIDAACIKNEKVRQQVIKERENPKFKAIAGRFREDAEDSDLVREAVGEHMAIVESRFDSLPAWQISQLMGTCKDEILGAMGIAVPGEESNE